MADVEVTQPEKVADDQRNLQEVADISQQPSDGGDQGGDTNSEMGNSLQSAHQNSEAQEDSESIGAAVGQSDSQAPISSRGSTKATGEDDSISVGSTGPLRQYGRADPRHPGRREQDASEPERDRYGHPILTNRYLRELFRTEWKKYYRTPELNEKLYLHFKGFSKMQNLEQFTDLKCLYFEGNGKFPSFSVPIQYLPNSNLNTYISINLINITIFFNRLRELARPGVEHKDAITVHPREHDPQDRGP